MSTLKTNFGCACVRKKSIINKNNDSCKQRLIIVLDIECDFSLKVVFFPLPLLPPFIINHPETVNCSHFLFVSTFGATLGDNCLVSVQRDCKLENNRRKLR